MTKRSSSEAVAQTNKRSSSEAVAQTNKRSSSEAVAQRKKSQTFLLPWPPSVNGMWRSVQGRNILSQRYRLWRDAAGKALLMQRPKHVLGPVKVAIELSPPDARRYDLDNRVKPVLDLLVANAVIDGDDHRIVREVTVSAREGFARAHANGARVTIAPFADG